MVKNELPTRASRFPEARDVARTFTTLSAELFRNRIFAKSAKNVIFNATLSRLAKKRHARLWCQGEWGINFRHPRRNGGAGFQKIIIFGPYRVGLEFWSLRNRPGRNISKNRKIDQNEKWANLAPESRAV